jgi:hypothetical protein
MYNFYGYWIVTFQRFNHPYAVVIALPVEPTKLSTEAKEHPAIGSRCRNSGNPSLINHVRIWGRTTFTESVHLGEQSTKRRLWLLRGERYVGEQTFFGIPPIKIIPKAGLSKNGNENCDRMVSSRIQAHIDQFL